ncbi:MAG: hypothetical protein QM503_12010 [Bacteroidota bacterium]
MNSALKILILGLLLTFSYSCNENDEVYSTNYVYISEGLKEKLIFKQGSYWIYENNINEIDSIVLIDIDSGYTSICPDNACALNEYIKLIYNNITQDFTFNHYYLRNFIRYNGGGDWGQDGQPIYAEDYQIDEGFNGLVLTDKYDSIEIMNSIYYDVEVMTIIANFQYQDEFNFNTDLFFSPHIGIIRMVTYDTIYGPNIWNLKRYKIEK